MNVAITKLSVAEALSQPSVITGVALSMTLYLTFFFGALKTKFATTDKQISWLLTFMSSGGLTIASIPRFYHFWKSGWNLQSFQDDRWIHHSVYTVITVYFLRYRLGGFFTTASILEMPTLIMALGSLRSRFRSDYLFAATFFAFRLVFHAFMIKTLKQNHQIRSLWIVAASIFPLHLFWFYGFIQQQMRKYRAFMKKRAAREQEELKQKMVVSEPSTSASSSATAAASRKEISRLRKFFANTKRLSFGSLTGAL
ncbi:hypothetical protein BC943DRAFT_336100 [Umbelopsis sp. AD052]|nr:hypothetical protein BC943DRAFT_336100 [Umbelopsis sp. AD052]